MNRLSKVQVNRIRTLRSEGYSIKELADLFDCSLSGIRQVVNNWSHYDKSYKPANERRVADIEYAILLRNQGYSFFEIALMEAERSKHKSFTPEYFRRKLLEEIGV